MEYSGRTSAYEHKREDWRNHKGPFSPSISQTTIFNAQWTDCPVEVEKEVSKLWSDQELANDTAYYKWDNEKDADVYPVISEYLLSKGITECLIHWWW